MISSKQVLYIIGVGRSGTSMLMTLLNGHSQIAFTPETHFLRFYFGTAHIQQQYEAQGPRAFQQTLEKDVYFKRLKLSAAQLLEPYLNEERPFDLSNFYLHLLGQYLQRKGKTFIGDKDPRYIDYLPIVKQVCPQAKIIHIYRDPRDIMLSKMKADWAAHRPYWLNAMISQIQMKNGRKAAQELFGDQYYELAYETLLSNPEASLSRLLNFLGLSFEPAMLDLTQSAKELVDESELQWKDNTFKPLMNTNSQKWLTKLSPKQIRCIEIICKEWFEKLAYTPAPIQIGSFNENLFKTLFSFEGLQELLYKRQLKIHMNKGAKR
ncbi:MAG: sulfotransferase [Bacteroidota bacterium]